MWFVADGDISHQQTALMVSRVSFLKNPEKEKPVLTEEYLKALLSALGNSRLEIQDTTIMVVLYDLAIRLIELLALQLLNVTLMGSTPHLRIHGKGDKERMCPSPVVRRSI
jgi:site-specific recombinase XerC